MSPENPCPMRKHVEQHFSGRISPEKELALREHLPGCEDCRKYYERSLAASRLDPKGMSFQTRLARGLGLRRRRGPIYATAALAVAAAAVLVLCMVQPAGNSGFTSRGAGEGRPQLLVYRFEPGGPPAPVAGEISAADELAFAYENTAGKKRLLVFGVDEQENIYWYHPAWTSDSDNPRAVPIESGRGVHELPEAVAHQIKGSSLRIYAVFTDEALSVRQAEERVRGRDLEKETLAEDACQTSILVKVRQ
jgi:hypothetical protein